MKQVQIDGRYDGVHGIGRYAREVCSRLPNEWRRAPLAGRAMSAADSFNLSRMTLGADVLLYSPGYSAGLARCTQLLTVHDLIHLDHKVGKGAPGRAYYHRVVKPAIRRAGSVITVSDTSKRVVEAWLDDPDVDVVNCGIGVSDAFYPRGMSTSHGPRYVMFVGNAKPHKNLRTLLRAMARLPGLRLVIVAQDDAEVSALIRDEGSRVDVTLTKGLSDDQLAVLYSGAACIVMPSLIEGFGLPAAEALRCLTPVVYYEECFSVAEIVGTFGSAFSVPDSDQELADAIEVAINVTVPADAIAGRYTWDPVATKVANVIDDLARR